MAVERGSNANQQKDTTAQPSTAMSDAFNRAGVNAGAQSTGQAGQQTRGARGGKPGNLFDVNNRLRRPISRNTLGEATQAFSKALQKEFEASMGSAFKENFSIHILDNNSAAVALSAILLCYNVSYQGTNHVAVFTMVVEGSAGRLANRFINIAGVNVEIDTVAGDVVDKTLWDKITVFLTDTYGMKLNLLNAGAMVLPTELSADDEAHMHRVAFQATSAVFTVMEAEATGQEEPLTVSMIDNGTNLSATLDYNPGDTDNAVGLPVRNDVSVILRGQMAQQSSGGVQSPHEQIRDITVVGGYVDLVYQDPQPQAYGQQQITQRYFPRFVITQLDSQIDAITPETTLLGLGTATLLSKSMAWGGAFASRYTQGPNLRDIGAIGYELTHLNPDPQAKPERIDTNADSFSNQSLFGLLTTAVHDALIYSMDIEEVGEMAWIHQMFIASANGNQDAYTAVYDACNKLTEGHFERVFQRGAPICVDDDNRVHLGYYEDGNGNRRDIREVDYLGLLNLVGDKDMQMVINWGRTFDDTSVPLPMRLEQRARIIKGILPTARIKGYARRITFNPEFILALNVACANAGLVIRPNNMLVNFQGQQGRGNYNASAFAVSGQQVTGGLFNYSQPAFGGFRGMGGPFTGRFGG